MNYFFGSKIQEKQITSDLTNHIKKQLKMQFCQICDQKPSNKVAFGDGVNPKFTCSDCELKAVGGSIQKLGQKNLITNDKLAEYITKQVISYQNTLKNPSPQQKKLDELIKELTLKSNQIISKIKDEMKNIKGKSMKKMVQLTLESQKQNTIPLFEQVSKMAKENKISQIDNGKIIINKIIVGNKGITFSDYQTIERKNGEINQRLTSLKKANKINLKQLNELIDEINSIQL